MVPFRQYERILPIQSQVSIHFLYTHVVPTHLHEHPQPIIEVNPPKHSDFLRLLVHRTLCSVILCQIQTNRICQQKEIGCIEYGASSNAIRDASASSSSACVFLPVLLGNIPLDGSLYVPLINIFPAISNRVHKIKNSPDWSETTTSSS